MMRAVLIIATAALLALSFSMEATAAGHDAMQYDWWWVFYETEVTRTREIFVPFRPFYMMVDRRNGREFRASLMPLVFWGYRTPHNDEWKSLLGLVGSVNYTHRDGRRDYDFGFFPFVLYGSSTASEDRYFHLWPFGGTIKGKLGQDRISTILFPGFVLFFIYPPVFPPTWTSAAILLLSLVPLYVEYDSGNYSAHGFLWPVYVRGSGGSREAFRILPFYSHNVKHGFYDNRSFLLLFNHQRYYLKNDTQTTFFAIPFYARRWSETENTGSSALLWPFFAWGYNRKSGNFAIHFPWPLVQIEDSISPYLYKRIYFPFYGIYRRENRETFFITPFYFSLETDTPSFISRYYYHFLIVWYFRRDYLSRPDPSYGWSWRYFKIWPLFQYEYDDRGNVSFNLLSLLPWRDPEGYERLYQPFWTLFEYKRTAEGERRLGILLRLYYQRWGHDYLDIKVPFLFSYSSRSEQLTELSFLMSMFSYYVSPDGAYIRLFWIPLRLGEGRSVAVYDEGGPFGLDGLPGEDGRYSRDDLVDFSMSVSPSFGPYVNFSSRCF